MELPSIGEGETMHFGFYLHADMPDADGDDNDILDDYYRIAINDISSTAWHSDDFNSDHGNNFWCGDVDIDGYSDGWLQYLDTPTIAIGMETEFSARLYYAIESPDGAAGEVEESCTDGWDAANIRISKDGGATWVLLEDPLNPYDFDCGYGWIYNDNEYEVGGRLNHLAKGWGGESGGWLDFSADLSEFANEEVIIRFVFGSDPAWSTSDDNTLTGFQVDDVLIEDETGVLFSDLGDNMSQMIATGEVWINQFYDYGSEEDGRPGATGWTFYSPGMPFVPSGGEANIYLDISEFAEKTIQFRIQTQYDNNDDGGQGSGLFIDDFWLYKLFSGMYVPPSNLIVEASDGAVMLVWDDMNLSGIEDFIHDNDTFDYPDGIRYNGWAGKSFDILGNGTINSVSIYNINEIDTTIFFGVFSKTGALFDLDPIYSHQQIDLVPGWNTVPVSGWDVSNSFIIAHEVNNGFGASYDASSSYNRSFLRFGEGAWDLAAYYGIDENGDGANDFELTGEFGIRANITYEGLDVTYNVYRDDIGIASSLSENTYIDSLVENNVTYEYAVSAIYSDGEESEKSSTVAATPISDTVHELFWDDGIAEVEFYASDANTAVSGNWSAVKYTASDSGEGITRFKWYQHGSGGAFYIKIFEDDGGNPGSEIYSKLQASGNQNGWNDKDLSSEELNISGAFWVGVKEFSTSKPFGLDNTSNVGYSYKRIGNDGDWIQVEGNLMYRVYLDYGGSAGRVMSSGKNEGEVSGGAYPIYSLNWEKKKLRKVPLQINGAYVFRTEKNPLLNRSNVLTDEIISLIVFDFEDDELTQLWTHDAGWSLTSSDYYSASHSYNSPNSNLLSVESMIIPNKYNIIEIYPNPFNPVANIYFEVAEFSQVKLSIIDLNGRIVSVLENGEMNPGQYQSLWDGNDNYGNQVSSGIYIAVFELNGMLLQARKLILLK